MILAISCPRWQTTLSDTLKTCMNDSRDSPPRVSTSARWFDIDSLRDYGLLFCFLKSKDSDWTTFRSVALLPSLFLESKKSRATQVNTSSSLYLPSQWRWLMCSCVLYKGRPGFSEITRKIQLRTWERERFPVFRWDGCEDGRLDALFFSVSQS